MFVPELNLKDTDSVFKSSWAARIMLTQNRLPEDMAFTSSLEMGDLLKRIFLASTQALKAAEEKLSEKTFEAEGFALEKSNLRASLDKAENALSEEHQRVYQAKEKLRVAEHAKRVAEEDAKSAKEALAKAEEFQAEIRERAVTDYRSSARVDPFKASSAPRGYFICFLLFL
ncbi:hypothetical protein NE237_009150 [Protea cynaroides]|uniref:Uncharacterized protein n=1 Tax=Protea cynaroides TaxID=273540 RepID=A0A9Q0R008_9MAGN|nr:hypothetical protein NE237_009150 [Protea cynaroides]